MSVTSGNQSMEFLTAILGLVPCFYDHTSKHTLYIRHLKKNLQELSKEMESLNDLYKDLKARVEREEQRQMVRTNQVGGWINEVEGLEKEVREILQRGDQEIQKRCLGCCPMNCWSSYKIRKEVSEKLVDVSVLIERGNNIQVVAEMLPRPLADELPMEETVGRELAYDTATGFLKDPQVGIVGLYGMGGVGKTTLLKKINNDFLASTTSTIHFDVVIWVVVSKPSNIEKIQEVIWNKLKIPHDVWESRSSKEEKAAEILRVLKTKRFVLLLDDIWERLDLLEMGVPIPRPDAQKIVFTTRSLDVCRQMKAQKIIEVACLPSEPAWTVFRKEVGEETLNSHPHIPRLAKVVVEECKGLPLALITLGRAMAGEKNPSNWDKVIQDLTQFPAEISGMEDQLFHRLKVSYDRLPDNVIKSCFLYCSLHPEDREIGCGALIDLWIGEGFLDEFHDIHEARIQGHKIIQKLKLACLLESCGSRERRVAMHDVIRDMALWLYNECGTEKKKVLVYNDVSRLKEAQEIPELKETEKMSLWDENVDKFPETMLCPNLKTLIMRECYKVKELSGGFFQFMPLLRVLDLCGVENLSELPFGIGKLVALRYLNLSETKIRELPIELTNLKNLLTLVLDDMEFLEIIPRGLVSSLVSLKLFSIYRTKVSIGVEERLLHELESMNGISEISISIYTTLSVNKVKSSHKLQRCLSYLQMDNCGDVISLELSSSILKRLKHLHDLAIINCNEFKDIRIEAEQEEVQKNVTLPCHIFVRENHFHALQNVFIEHCSKLLNLTWLVYAPYLEQLYVSSCESLEQLICHSVEESLDVFSRLKYLRLDRLPRLESIYQHPLLFPSLEVIKVYDCKSLRSLPFNFNPSTSNLKKIKGETSWWNQLEWNDETIKHALTPHFQIHQAEASDTDTEESESEESETNGKDDMPEQLISN